MNMSYCQYENTLADLRQLKSSWHDDRSLSESESIAKAELIQLMKELLSLEGSISHER